MQSVYDLFMRIFPRFSWLNLIEIYSLKTFLRIKIELQFIQGNLDKLKNSLGVDDCKMGNSMADKGGLTKGKSIQMSLHRHFQ